MLLFASPKVECSRKLLDASPKVECSGKLLDAKIKPFGSVTTSLFIYSFVINTLIGAETPRGSVHSAYSSSAHPRGAITTYHVFSMCAYKIDMTI